MRTQETVKTAAASVLVYIAIKRTLEARRARKQGHRTGFARLRRQK